MAVLFLLYRKKKQKKWQAYFLKYQKVHQIISKTFYWLSQVFSLGVIAQRLNTRLFFDSRMKQITNNEFANAMLIGTPPRKGWDEFYKL